MAPSATPATRNEGGCRQVPRLPRKVWRRRRPLVRGCPSSDGLTSAPPTKPAAEEVDKQFKTRRYIGETEGLEKHIVQ